MDRRAACLLALLLALALAPDASAKCEGTAERPAYLLTLGNKAKFCLRMPRYLPNPVKADYGTASFGRTVNDTCGLYSIVLHGKDPQGAGPPPHVHFADEEFFLPTTPGNVVRIFAQSDATKLRVYKPGEVPGWTVPAITSVGHADVPYGSIGYSPMAVPHTYKGATELDGITAIWLNGFAMIPAINIPMSNNLTDEEKMWKTSMWGVPTDITSAMFGGPDFTTRALANKVALPPTTPAILRRLQKAFDAGEACFPK